MRGPLTLRDAEVLEHWRRASPAAHAQAMIELARYAERMARQTGLGKQAGRRFPGFGKRLAPRRSAGEGDAAR